MFYQFEFVTIAEESYGSIDNQNKLYIWLIEGTKKILLFMVNIDFSWHECAQMYQTVKNNNLENINCHIWSPDYGAHYYISTVIDDVDNKFITLSEYFMLDDKKEESFKLILAWDQCDKDSFLEFLRQTILHMEPITINYNDQQHTKYHELCKNYKEQCKKYGMYIAINENIINRLLNN